MNDKNISLFFFSSNFKKHTPFQILKNLYKMNKLNKKLTYFDNNNNFKYNIIINEISDFNDVKKSTFYDYDSIITFIDLENYYSFEFLVNIIEIIKSNFSYEKQIYFIGLYKDEKQIKEILSENNLKHFFESYNINKEYMQININFSSKLKIFFDGIIEDILQKQEYYEKYYQKDEMIDSQSNSINFDTCIFC